MHCIIFANGDLPTSPLPLPDHDLLIAADGGARNAFKFGLVPGVLIGDFDSLSEEEVARIELAGARPIRHPADKDETDLELAIDFAIESGAKQITLYGLFGGRWDMTFANLLLLGNPKYAAVRLTAISGDTTLHILRGGERFTFSGKPGWIVSVLPLGGPALGVSYEGLDWPLDHATLPFGSPKGVSNRMNASIASIALQQGVIVVVVSSASS